MSEHNELRTLLKRLCELDPERFRRDAFNLDIMRDGVWFELRLYLIGDSHTDDHILCAILDGAAERGWRPRLGWDEQDNWWFSLPIPGDPKICFEHDPSLVLAVVRCYLRALEAVQPQTTAREWWATSTLVYQSANCHAPLLIGAFHAPNCPDCGANLSGDTCTCACLLDAAGNVVKGGE